MSEYQDKQLAVLNAILDELKKINATSTVVTLPSVKDLASQQSARGYQYGGTE